MTSRLTLERWVMRFEIRLEVRFGLPAGAFRAGAFDFAGPAWPACGWLFG
jgi:hypothetical protein